MQSRPKHRWKYKYKHKYKYKMNTNTNTKINTNTKANSKLVRSFLSVLKMRVEEVQRCIKLAEDTRLPKQLTFIPFYKILFSLFSSFTYFSSDDQADPTTESLGNSTLHDTVTQFVLGPPILFLTVRDEAQPHMWRNFQMIFTNQNSNSQTVHVLASLCSRIATRPGKLKNLVQVARCVLPSAHYAAPAYSKSSLGLKYNFC